MTVSAIQCRGKKARRASLGVEEGHCRHLYHPEDASHGAWYHIASLRA